MKHSFTRFLALSLLLALASVARAEETTAVLYTGKLSALSIPADALGADWTGPSGLVVNDFRDLSNCPIEVLPVIAALKKKYTLIGVLGCADFTYRKKANPFHQVTLRVFVFDSPKSCAKWCEKKYEYEGWEKHYTIVSGVSYKAVDSTQITKRAVWFGNIWMTCHTLTISTDHLRLLDSYLSKIGTPSGEEKMKAKKNGEKSN